MATNKQNNIVLFYDYATILCPVNIIRRELFFNVEVT